MTKPSPLYIQFFQTSWEGAFALKNQIFAQPGAPSEEETKPPRLIREQGEQVSPGGIFPQLLLCLCLAVAPRCGWWRFPPGHTWGTLWQPACAVKAEIESKYFP